MGGLNFNPTNQRIAGPSEFRKHLLRSVYRVQGTYDFLRVIEEDKVLEIRSI
jgi:hypothetical protein